MFKFVCLKFGSFLFLFLFLLFFFLFFFFFSFFTLFFKFVFILPGISVFYFRFCIFPRSAWVCFFIHVFNLSIISCFLFVWFFKFSTFTFIFVFHWSLIHNFDKSLYRYYHASHFHDLFVFIHFNLFLLFIVHFICLLSLWLYSFFHHFKCIVLFWRFLYNIICFNLKR